MLRHFPVSWLLVYNKSSNHLVFLQVYYESEQITKIEWKVSGIRLRSTVLNDVVPAVELHEIMERQKVDRSILSSNSGSTLDFVRNLKKKTRHSFIKISFSIYLVNNSIMY